jgi:pyridoxal phosphate enzyme (YggS family)
VKPDPASLDGRLGEIRDSIAEAAERSGRRATDVTLIAVTKTVAPERIAEAIALGVRDFGENRVQEAETKIAALGRDGLRWHLIGHLQSNKAGRAAALFDRIHGLDSLALAETLSRRSALGSRPMPVMIEVNVSGEPAKYGVAPEDLGALAERVAGLQGLALDGLMMVGAQVERPEQARAGFARLRELREATERRLGRRLPELSMGMSGDYAVAVEEGSTMVRVGTALFGART